MLITSVSLHWFIKLLPSDKLLQCLCLGLLLWKVGAGSGVIFDFLVSGGRCLDWLIPLQVKISFSVVACRRLLTLSFTVSLGTSSQTLNGSLTLELVNEKYWKVRKPLELYYAPTKDQQPQQQKSPTPLREAWGGAKGCFSLQACAVFVLQVEVELPQFYGKSASFFSSFTGINLGYLISTLNGVYHLSWFISSGKQTDQKLER